MKVASRAGAAILATVATLTLAGCADDEPVTRAVAAGEPNPAGATALPAPTPTPSPTAPDLGTVTVERRPTPTSAVAPSPATTTITAGALTATTTPPSPATTALGPEWQQRDGTVLIEAAASGDPERLLADLVGLGLTGGGRFGVLVNGWLPVGALEQARGLASLQFLRPAAGTGNASSSLY